MIIRRGRSEEKEIGDPVLHKLQGFIHKKKSQDSQFQKKSLAWGEINVCQADWLSGGTSCTRKAFWSQPQQPDLIVSQRLPSAFD